MSCRHREALKRITEIIRVDESCSTCSLNFEVIMKTLEFYGLAERSSR